MNRKNGKYIPAFSYSPLTPLYDSIMKHAMRESIFKNRLASHVRRARELGFNLSKAARQTSVNIVVCVGMLEFDVDNFVR